MTGRMAAYALGLDYGTNSCRALLLDLETGEPVADAVFDYPTGEQGIVLDARDPNLARQHPRDYLDGLVESVRAVIALARDVAPGFTPEQIKGIGVDTTGSTPIPVDAKAQPLALDPKFEDNPDAMAWLWRDHTSFAEAEEITRLASRERPEFLASIGGVYSSEWFWSKLWCCLNNAPEVFDAAYSWVELSDYIPAVLAGAGKPEDVVRGVCAHNGLGVYERSRSPRRWIPSRSSETVWMTSYLNYVP